MKIRLNYVSNSSSTSFCILGIICPPSFNLDALDFSDNFIVCLEGIYNYYGKTIIGANPNSMKDDETLMQFKERICAKFKEYKWDVKPEELKWFIDGGYDG